MLPVVDTVLIAVLWSQSLPSAKSMFYDPGGVGCGIHFWLETEQGTRLSERAAARTPGKYTLHLRNNIGAGFLTVWDVTSGRELTPKDERFSGGGRWSGYPMKDRSYLVPGTFEFAEGKAATHLVIVWARSQTEVAHTAPDALARLKEMPLWMPIVLEVDDSTPGEIGTYVMNRMDAGVVTE